jgi:hypothetical protein
VTPSSGSPSEDRAHVRAHRVSPSAAAHGSATTTARTRADIQASAEPATTLARRYGVNRKTVLKWRGREDVADLPIGPRERRSTVVSAILWVLRTGAPRRDLPERFGSWSTAWSPFRR